MTPYRLGASRRPSAADYGFLVRGLRQGLRKVSPRCCGRCCRPTVDGLGKTECRFCWCPLVLDVDTYRL
jgi:hypothetical protein